MSILTIPIPGDKIIVTDPDLSQYFGKEWVVIEKPKFSKFIGPQGFDIIWIGPESNPDWPNPKTWVFLTPNQYKIVK